MSVSRAQPASVRVDTPLLPLPQGHHGGSSVSCSQAGSFFYSRHCPLVTQLVLAILAGTLGVVTLIIEQVGLVPGNSSKDDPPWYYLRNDVGPVGAGFGGGILAISTAIFAVSILIQLIRLKSDQANVLQASTSLLCQVTSLTNIMGFMSASLVVAASCSIVYYGYFPGTVNGIILALMAVIMFAGSLVGCCVSCNASCGGCCTQCCLSASMIYQPLPSTYPSESTQQWPTLEPPTYGQAHVQPSAPSGHQASYQDSRAMNVQQGQFLAAKPVSYTSIQPPLFAADTSSSGAGTLSGNDHVASSL